ncbi:hypothetical protein KY317_03745, partial [Candidatus Woesearchaeota archaeon]|nr:hypothetical protein [Candidatus Woesearchaeota archaeon]
ELPIKKSHYLLEPEQEDNYEADYEDKDEEDNGIDTTMQGDPFFRQEIDADDLMIDDNPREDFESYFGLYGNAIARQGISFDCINIRRLLKNGIYNMD